MHQKENNEINFALSVAAERFIQKQRDLCLICRFYHAGRVKWRA